MNDIQIVQMSGIEVVPAQPITCLALGNFDGVHIGHQKLILEAKRISVENQSICAIMTFHPHPRAIVTQNNDYHFFITPWENKKDILRELGVELVLLVDFNHEFASISPLEFVTGYINKANAQNVVIGEDFRYGYSGQGSSITLAEDGAAIGFNVITVPPVMYGEHKVSSSMIRKLIDDGNIVEINRLLDRPYQIRGNVVDGEKRGRLLGFPTANISLTDNYILPKNGVYIVEVSYERKKYLAVLNIGHKPTFNKNTNGPTIEAHILNFDKNIYNSHLKIDFLEFIRPEIRFDNKEQLIDQIQKDISITSSFYKKQ